MEATMLSCLIVTGDKPARDSLRVGFEQLQGFEIETADGGWARELVRTHVYDLIIADTQLGDGSDGLDFLRAAKKELPDAQMALITHGKSGRIGSRERSGLDLAAVFRVPVTTTEFFSAVSRLLERIGAPTHQS
jgi:DNA-binding response OmpR family regulator